MLSIQVIEINRKQMRWSLELEAGARDADLPVGYGICRNKPADKLRFDNLFHLV